MRRATPRRGRGDLRWSFVNNEAFRARIEGAEDDALTPTGLDVQLRCEHCGWSPMPFPFDPWVFRGLTEQHFTLIAVQRAYRCKSR